MASTKYALDVRSPRKSTSIPKVLSSPLHSFTLNTDLPYLDLIRPLGGGPLRSAAGRAGRGVYILAVNVLRFVLGSILAPRVALLEAVELELWGLVVSVVRGLEVCLDGGAHSLAFARGNPSWRGVWESWWMEGKVFRNSREGR